MIIVDSSVWIDYFKGAINAPSHWLYTNMDRRRMGVTDLILCEVLQGAKSEADARSIQEELALFALFAPGGESLSLSAAHNYRLLRKHGITVRKTIDCLIATFCILEGHSLLHHDRDVNHFEKHLGLQVIHP